MRLLEELQILCLNPCFNGRYSQSLGRQRSPFLIFVLILVLMEDTLRAFSERLSNKSLHAVLILVLMEDTLRGSRMLSVARLFRGLNPCFNGRYSQRVDIFTIPGSANSS